MKRTLIIGMAGQDGSFLAEYVLEREYAGATHRVRELVISFDHVALNRRSRPSGLVHVDVAAPASVEPCRPEGLGRWL